MSAVSGDISLDTFASNLAVGSKSGGHDFGLVGSVHHGIQEMTVYIAYGCIGKVVAKKSDHSCITIGRTDSTLKKTWNFEPDERFTRIRLYSRDNHLVGIKLSTNEHQQLEALALGEIPDPVEIPVGSGKCVGVFGNSGKIVDSLGFAMLKK